MNCWDLSRTSQISKLVADAKYFAVDIFTDARAARPELITRFQGTATEEWLSENTWAIRHVKGSQFWKFRG